MDSSDNHSPRGVFPKLMSKRENIAGLDPKVIWDLYKVYISLDALAINNRISM